MKKIVSLLIITLMSFLSVNSYAQKNKSGNDYNLQKAYEVLNEEKDETKGLDLVNKQLQETPDNVEALLLYARLNRRKGEFGTAISAINHALKVNKPKKTEIAMSTLHWWKGLGKTTGITSSPSPSSMDAPWHILTGWTRPMRSSTPC